MKVVIYRRVSTSDQSCELQRRELADYFKRRCRQIPGEYLNTGWSGSKANRPELNRLMNDRGKENA